MISAIIVITAIQMQNFVGMHGICSNQRILAENLVFVQKSSTTETTQLTQDVVMMQAKTTAGTVRSIWILCISPRLELICIIKIITNYHYHYYRLVQC